MEIGLNHPLNYFLESNLSLPPQQAFRLRRIATEQVYFGWP